MRLISSVSGVWSPAMGSCARNTPASGSSRFHTEPSVPYQVCFWMRKSEWYGSGATGISDSGSSNMSTGTMSGMTSKSGIGSISAMSEFYRPSDALNASLAVDLSPDLGRRGSEVRVRDRHAALIRDLLQTFERPGHVSDRLRQDRLLVAEVVLHDRVAGRQRPATVAEQDLGAEVRLEVGHAAVGVPVVLVPEGAGAAHVAVPLLDVTQTVVELELRVRSLAATHGRPGRVEELEQAVGRRRRVLRPRVPRRLAGQKPVEVGELVAPTLLLQHRLGHLLDRAVGDVGVVGAAAERHGLDELVGLLLRQGGEDLVADAHHELRQSTGADGLRGLGQEALHVALDVVGDVHRPASAGRRADLHLEQLLPQVARSVGVAVEVTQRTIAQVKVGVVVVIGVSPDYSPAQLVEERHHLVEVRHLLRRLA